MTSQKTRVLVWHELLDATRFVRYYQALTDRYIFLNRFTRILLLLSASTCIAVVVEWLPLTLQAIAGAVVALVVVIDFGYDFSSKAAVLKTILFDCTNLQGDLEVLWSQIDSDSLTESEVMQEYIRIAKLINETTSQASKHDIRVDKKLNEQCEESADKFIEERYTQHEI